MTLNFTLPNLSRFLVRVPAALAGGGDAGELCFGFLDFRGHPCVNVTLPNLRTRPPRRSRFRLAIGRCHDQGDQVLSPARRIAISSVHSPTP